jgi:hypothetical protein
VVSSGEYIDLCTTDAEVLTVDTPENLMLSGSLAVLSNSAPNLINIYESVTFIGAQQFFHINQTQTTWGAA